MDGPIGHYVVDGGIPPNPKNLCRWKEKFNKFVTEATQESRSLRCICKFVGARYLSVCSTYKEVCPGIVLFFRKLFVTFSIVHDFSLERLIIVVAHICQFRKPQVACL